MRRDVVTKSVPCSSRPHAACKAVTVVDRGGSVAEEARALVEWGRGGAVLDSAGANEPAAFRNMKGCPGERKRQPALQNDFEDSRVYLHPH